MIVASKLPTQYSLGTAGSRLDRGAAVTLWGCHPHGAPAENLYLGFSITRDVPKEIWDAWYAQNRFGALVTNRIIHAEENEVLLRAWISKNVDAVSGLEGRQV